MMINETRILNEFIELVSVPCPSKDEKAEADLLVQKLQAMGLEVKVDDAGRKIGGTTGNVWAFLPGNVEGAAGLFFEAHMDSVPPTTGTKVVRRDGVLYSDGTTTLGGDDKVGIAAVLEAVRAVQEQNIPHGDIQLCFTIAEEIGCLGVVNLDPKDIRLISVIAWISVVRPVSLRTLRRGCSIFILQSKVSRLMQVSSLKKVSMPLCWRRKL